MLDKCVLCRSPLVRPPRDVDEDEIATDCTWALAMAMVMVIACGSRRPSLSSGVLEID
jgi:hypothetical protein